MLVSPLQVGDAAVGHLTEALIFIVEHVIPKVHTFLSWDSESSDLGPILPVCTMRGVIVRRACAGIRERLPRADREAFELLF